MQYKIIRSRRRTIALEIRPDASLVVRAPRLLPTLFIEKLLREKEAWILKKQKVMQERQEKESLPVADLKRARQIAEERTAYWSEQMGVKTPLVRVNNARRQWGSCSARNTLSFALRLFAAPVEIIDYVVVHELAHLQYKNHGARFWQRVASFLPDYKNRQKWLKEHGHLLA